MLDKSACTHFHRTGLLCGDCEEGYSPFVLSYNLSCVRCPDGHKNWWKFILAGFVPLTFFYFFVIIFNINVTSSRLHRLVWFSQTLSMPALIRLIMSALSHESPHLLNTIKTFLIFYNFLNLDLLHSVIPDICLNVNHPPGVSSGLFVSIPTMIFFLYPFKCFHSFLSIFPLNWHFLHAFVDSFQGCYKDGTEPGTFDCRWFSTFTLIIRLLLFIMFGMTLSVIFFVYAVLALVIFLIAVINLQLFKKVAARYPSTDTVFYILLSLEFLQHYVLLFSLHVVFKLNYEFDNYVCCRWGGLFNMSKCMHFCIFAKL